MNNAEIASVLEEVADVLEIQGENTFRIRAYRNAARTIEVLTTPLSRTVEEGKPLTDLPGIGKEMANHIREMVETGTLGYRAQELDLMRCGVEQARRAGLEAKDVINTLPYEELRKTFERS